MSQNIISPSIEDPKYTSVFLAGGITNCKNWQKEVIKELNDIEKLTIYNPRRTNFDLSNKNINHEQIEWEFE